MALKTLPELYLNRLFLIDQNVPNCYSLKSLKSILPYRLECIFSLIAISTVPFQTLVINRGALKKFKRCHLFMNLTKITSKLWIAVPPNGFITKNRKVSVGVGWVTRLRAEITYGQN